MSLRDEAIRRQRGGSQGFTSLRHKDSLRSVDSRTVDSRRRDANTRGGDVREGVLHGDVERRDGVAVERGRRHDEASLRSRWRAGRRRRAGTGRIARLESNAQADAQRDSWEEMQTRKSVRGVSSEKGQTRTKHNCRDEQDGAYHARGRASAAVFFGALLLLRLQRADQSRGPHLLHRDDAGVLLLHPLWEERQGCVSKGAARKNGRLGRRGPEPRHGAALPHDLLTNARRRRSEAPSTPRTGGHEEGRRALPLNWRF